MRAHVAAIALALVFALFATGCITRHIRQDVYEQGRIQVFLRRDKQLLSDVPKGYDHPATVAATRMAHILSRLDLRKSAKEGNRRLPAIPTDMLYPIAEGISQSLSKADEDQEVVVMAIRNERSLGVLTNDYLTSLIAYIRADKLYIHISRAEFLLKDTHRPGQKLPQPRLSDTPDEFKLYGGTAMTLLGSNAVAVAWRDPVFRRPTRTKILPTGEVKRKTILLEGPAEGDLLEDELLEAEEGRPAMPPGLSPDQLRKLADLEEARLAGQITETEYRNRQRDILDGR